MKRRSLSRILPFTRISAGRAVRWSSVLLFAALAPRAAAQVTDFRLEQIDNSSGGPALEEFVTNNLVIDFNGQYTGSQILLELDRGSIYQDLLGSNSPPSSGLVAMFPSVAFDTYLAMGSATSDGPFGAANLVGGAVNLGGESTISLETGRINAAWGPQGGADITDQTGFLTARITLSDDAEGSWRLLASAGGVISIIGPPELIGGDTTPDAIHFAESGVVRGGAFHFAPEIPEPGTMALALTVLLTASLRRQLRVLTAGR